MGGAHGRCGAESRGDAAIEGSGDGREGKRTRAPTDRPATMLGTDCVRRKPMTPPLAVNPPRMKAMFSRDYGGYVSTRYPMA
jgi:hypothetical protein